MKSVGIICEYNPFHNGHIYHIHKVKEMFGDCIIVLVMSGYFTQRGDISILDKWTKVKLALQYGVDLVVELPFIYATQSADIFAKGAITLLNALRVDYLVFGSECNNLELLTQIASSQLENPLYECYVKSYIENGYNYPTAISKSLERLGIPSVTSPNDLLGISYLKAILKQNSSIQAFCIQRTNHYHALFLEGNISSASSIRSSLKRGENIRNQVPNACYLNLPKDFSFEDRYFSFIQYAISMNENLIDYQDVDDSILARMKKNIDCKSLDDFILHIKMRRYTYNRIKRMLLHITCHLTKEEAKLPISYIRVLGFSALGQSFLHHQKKEFLLPLITKYSQNIPLLSIELRISYLYSLLMNDFSYVQAEYKNCPIHT